MDRYRESDKSIPKMLDVPFIVMFLLLCLMTLGLLIGG